jgi:hypothetical protein
MARDNSILKQIQIRVSHNEPELKSPTSNSKLSLCSVGSKSICAHVCITEHVEINIEAEMAMRNGVRYQKMSNQSTASTTTNSMDRQLACWAPSQDRIKLCHVIRSKAILVSASNPSRVLYGINYCRSRRLALFESEAYARDRKQTHLLCAIFCIFAMAN